ncbi:hypothetical protein ACLB2K_073523 [Fragaria x ananassa]
MDPEPNTSLNISSSSRRSLSSSSIQSKPPIRYGSRGADSEAAASQKEMNDEDVRMIHINDTHERVAYLYFLVIAVLNQLPQLAVFGRGVSVLPLAFVLLVTAVKDAYEDYRRHRSDRIENNRLASVFVNNHFQFKKWKDVQVGEIIKIEANEGIPCDMVLLSTSDPTGVAYVQTINLDGESNLKTR